MSLEELVEAWAPLPDGGRALMQALIEGAGPELEGDEGLRTAKSLQSIRDAARGELTPLTPEQIAVLGVSVDAIMVLDERAVWVYGWVHDPQGLIDRLEAVSPVGGRFDLLDGAYRYARPDVAEVHAAAGGHGQLHGFSRYLRTSPSHPAADRMAHRDAGRVR